jgi:hypothetical protein
MGLDIRLPIGLMFATLGVVLVLCGLLMDEAIYESSLGINVNLWWGLVMLIFGGLMFGSGRSAIAVSETVEGEKIEEMEHRTGLESDQEEN